MRKINSVAPLKFYLFCRLSEVQSDSFYTAQKMKFSIKDSFSKCDQQKTSFFVQRYTSILQTLLLYNLQSIIGITLTYTPLEKVLF